jgi:hypothetical protein
MDWEGMPCPMTKDHTLALSLSLAHPAAAAAAGWLLTPQHREAIARAGAQAGRVRAVVSHAAQGGRQLDRELPQRRHRVRPGHCPARRWQLLLLRRPARAHAYIFYAVRFD